jgi:hypothetical protein
MAPSLYLDENMKYLVSAKNCEFGPKPELYQFLPLDFSLIWRCFLDLFYYADEELNGIAPSSSRFRDIKKIAPKHKFGQKPLAFRFFVLFQ